MRLKELRNDHKKKQTDLSDLLKISKSTYCCYEQGTCEPSISSLIKLADYYHVSLDYLVGRVWRDEVGYLTPEQREAVNELKKLSEINLFKATAYIKGLIAGQESKER